MFFVQGLFDRRDSWGSPQHPHDPRGPSRDEPRDPRMMRGPGPPPPDTNESKPAIRPLMSLSPPPLPLGQSGFDFKLDDDLWKGAPDRRGRKRSGDQEGFREPKSLRPEDEWRRGPGLLSATTMNVSLSSFESFESRAFYTFFNCYFEVNSADVRHRSPG